MEFWITVFTSLVVSAASSPFTSKQYRTDYEYSRETDAFYKLHTEGNFYSQAPRKCTDEGAELIKVTSDREIKQVHAMMKKFPDLGDYVMVESDGGQHESVEDENPMVNLVDYGFRDGYEYNVVSRQGEVKTETNMYKELPFVCKVQARDAPYSEECGVYSNGYVSRIATTGSCYRLSAAQATSTWNEAYANCQAEGGHLVILNNEGEREVVNNLWKEKPHDYTSQFFAGVRATKTGPRVFKTIFNQTLEEVGYGPWEENEPNNYHGGEDCVALDGRRDGRYNDVWCYLTLSYVCESSGRAPRGP